MSLSKHLCATPDTEVCTFAPPSSSWVTSSLVTVLTTSGPVTNRWLVPRTMKTKSVIAGEYTAPPAHGPMTREIWGTAPEARTLRWKTSAYPARESTPSWILAPPESLRPMTGMPIVTALSMILQIFSAWVSESEPPNTVKSWLNTNTGRPLIRPDPVTTPSPGGVCASIPKSVQRWVLSWSYSRKDPLSSSTSSLSLAVSFPFACCFFILASPPPSVAFWRMSSSLCMVLSLCDCDS
mmetsp:Transcript_19008/g.46679  ORF Transcript_19008/g.46679 Transcript_19008/m.46679 type:complete len:238 (+) Transcript_19008:274-987(+)